MPLYIYRPITDTYTIQKESKEKKIKENIYRNKIVNEAQITL